MILTNYDGVSTPLRRYTPVKSAVDATQTQADFHDHVRDLALDCLNQGGISNLLIIRSADHDQQP
jgi:hypothetical protein